MDKNDLPPELVSVLKTVGSAQRKFISIMMVILSALVTKAWSTLEDIKTAQAVSAAQAAHTHDSIQSLQVEQNSLRLDITDLKGGIIEVKTQLADKRGGQ